MIGLRGRYLDVGVVSVKVSSVLPIFALVSPSLPWKFLNLFVVHVDWLGNPL